MEFEPFILVIYLIDLFLQTFEVGFSQNNKLIAGFFFRCRTTKFHNNRQHYNFCDGLDFIMTKLESFQAYGRTSMDHCSPNPEAGNFVTGYARTLLRLTCQVPVLSLFVTLLYSHQMLINVAVTIVSNKCHILFVARDFKFYGAKDQ